jgi:hypothetical protein
MRSTNIVLFLLLLNLSAGVMGAAGVVDVDVGVPGGDQIELVEGTSVVDRSQDQPRPMRSPAASSMPAGSSASCGPSSAPGLRC